MKRKFFMCLRIILVFLIIFLMWPSNYYLRQTIRHGYPSIDDIKIFPFHVIKAKDPKPWITSEKYNQKELDKKYIPAFEELKTIAFLVVRHEEIVFEKYWESYDEYSLTNSFSMAKSIVGLLVGCAIDDGLIKSVNQPVKDFVPNFDHPEFTTLTIRHLLTMSAGVDFDEAYSSVFSKTTRFYYGNNLEEMTLNMKQIEEPGKFFYYQSGVTQLLALILEKATGKGLSDYASEKLWTPIHAEKDAVWSLDKKDGVEKAFCCIYSNARDFARLGQLILNKGKWDNKQIISTSYLDASLTPDTTLISRKLQRVNKLYGYQWWIIPQKEETVYLAKGLYGQYIYVLPAHNAVIVRLGHKRSEVRDSNDNPIDERIWLKAGLEILGI